MVVFIDLSKAVDSIEHHTLLGKISRLGVSPAVHEWFRSYLADRSQYIRIGTTTSLTAPLTHGIPQGSVLLPFLFNIYTDSLPSIPESCSLKSYVDDSKEYLSFSQPILDHSLSILEEELHRVFERTLINIINALVISKVYFSSSIWSNTSEENIKKVQLIQNYAARVIVGNVGKHDHVSPLLKELGWLPIKEHLQYRDAVLMYKCMYNQAPSYLSQMFTKRNQIHDRETRNQNELDIPKYRTATGQRTFKYRGTKIWNALDEELKSTANLKHFKFKLKARLLGGNK